MINYYIGHYVDTCNVERTEIFEADSAYEATPEFTGYLHVDGPYDTVEDAECNLM